MHKQLYVFALDRLKRVPSFSYPMQRKKYFSLTVSLFLCNLHIISILQNERYFSNRYLSLFSPQNRFISVYPSLFLGYLSFHFFAFYVSSCQMDLASWLLFTCCLYIMLLISMAFDAFIRVLFYRHLHRSTRVNRSLHPCKQVCAPRWTCLFTWVER